MTTALSSDPRQWHRSRAWTDALVKVLPAHQPMTLTPDVRSLPSRAYGCEAVGRDVQLRIGDAAFWLHADAPADSGGVLFTAENLLAADGSTEGRKGVKLLEEWLRGAIAKAPPPAQAVRSQPAFWEPHTDSTVAVGAGRDTSTAPGQRRYRLRLDFSLPAPHFGLLKAQGGSFAEALASAAQLHWYIAGSFLNIAERGAYAGRIQCLGAGSTHLPGPGTGGEAVRVAPRFSAWIELGGGRDRLIQAALELRRLADTLASDVCLRGEMGLVTDAAPLLSGAPEDLFLWSGSLNWGERLLMSWEQAGWLRELVEFLVELHRKRVLKESLLRALSQAAQWSGRGETGTVRVVRVLTEYFDRHGRNRHFPADAARRLALSLGRNEKFIRHRPAPSKAGLARVDELTALAVRLVRLQCGMKRPASYCRPRHLENNGAVRAAVRAAGAKIV